MTLVFANVYSNRKYKEKSSLNSSKKKLPILANAFCEKAFCETLTSLTKSVYTLFAFRKDFVRSFLFYHCLQIVCSELESNFFTSGKKSYWVCHGDRLPGERRRTKFCEKTFRETLRTNFYTLFMVRTSFMLRTNFVVLSDFVVVRESCVAHLKELRCSHVEAALLATHHTLRFWHMNVFWNEDVIICWAGCNKVGIARV